MDGHFYVFVTVALSSTSLCIIRDLTTCHDDFELKPPDGVLPENTFTWLGFVQYMHITTGLPHHSKAPRVVLLHKQFVVGAALDLLHLPKNYKLGNIIFGDYEREEEDCGITRSQLKLGIKCPRAYIEMPITEVTPHPEYSRFGVGNSLAIIKLLRPMKSTVPTDFDRERLGKKTLKLYTHRDCRRHRMKTKLGSEGVTHVICSSGCGVRPGAPIVTHAIDGVFELVGIAAGGGACTHKSMRRRLNVEPPLYIDVYPYNTWIINVITAHVIPQPFSQNFQLMEGGSSMDVNKGAYLRSKNRAEKAYWRGRSFVVGNMCFRSEKTQRSTSFFYMERFLVYADQPTKLSVVLKISAGVECTITCARMLMPNQLHRPQITGVGTYKIEVRFNTDWFPFTFYFSVGLSGRNSTDADLVKWLPDKNKGFW